MGPQPLALDAHAIDVRGLDLRGHDPRTQARLSAYQLMEGLQGDAADQALEQLHCLRRQAPEGWPEVEFLAELGITMDRVLRDRDRNWTTVALDALVAQGEALASPALVAHALGLRSVHRVAKDSEAALSDLTRAVALLDSPGLPPLEACTALVVCAAGFNALSLWELVDELYDRALDLVPDCEEPIQLAAIAINRVLIRLEWACTLIEQGEYDAAGALLTRAAEATEAAAEVPTLPALWQEDIAAGRTALRLIIDPPEDPAELLAEARTQQAALRAAGDLEMLPLAEGLAALALIRLGRFHDALAWLAVDTVQSTSSGATSFRLWLRAQAMAKIADPEAASALSAYDDYNRLLITQRRDARRAMLTAARSRIAGERLRTEAERLSRDIELDPLTGLGNRRSFDAWMSADRATTTPTAMLLIDLNGFKAVNDAHGHLVGDEVLRRIGQVIADRVRPGDRAIRLGGDEFVIIIESAPTDTSRRDALPATAARRAHALQSAIEGQPWAELTPGLMVGATIGIAVRTIEPHDREATASMYAEADRDLYARKIPAQRGIGPNHLRPQEL